MKYYGEIQPTLSEKEKLYALNCQRNFEGWYDKLWEQVDPRGKQKMALLRGEAVVEHNETCSARYQLTQAGDLQVVIVHTGETKCITIERLTGARRVDFCVEQPFIYENEVENADNIV